MNFFWNSFNNGFLYGMLFGNPLFDCFNNFFSANFMSMPFVPFSNFMTFSYYQPKLPSIFPSFSSMPNIDSFTYSGKTSDSPSLYSNNNYYSGNWYSDFSSGSTNYTSSNNTMTKTSNKTYSEAADYTATRTTSSSSNSKAKPAISTGKNAEKTRNQTSHIKNYRWVYLTDSEMQQVYGNYNRDIREPYKGSVVKLNNYLKGKGKLEGLGQVFMDAQAKYGISASVLIGICMNESNQGKSRLARENNNFCGVKEFAPKGQKFSNGKNWRWRKFNSPAECINYVANILKTKYITPPEKGKVSSLTKLYQINAKYCPVGDNIDNLNLNKYWARNVEKYASEAENV